MSDLKVTFASAKFALYVKHGLGEYHNWLTMETDEIYESEVVKALRVPEVRKEAAKHLHAQQAHIFELQQLLERSK